MRQPSVQNVVTRCVWQVVIIVTLCFGLLKACFWPGLLVHNTTFGRIYLFALPLTANPTSADHVVCILKCKQ